MNLLAQNNANSVLAASATPTATSITVVNASTSNFPVPVEGESYFLLTIIDAATGMLREIVKVTAVNGNVMTVQRAQENTVARTWNANDVVANLITAGTLSAFPQFDEFNYEVTKLNNLSSDVNALTHQVSDLRDSEGLSLIGQVATIADLRTINLSTAGQQVFVKEHHAGSNNGGGIFTLFSLTSTASDVDDDGCQILTESGQIFRRKGIHYIYSDYFGLSAGDSIDAPLENMFKATRTFNIEQIFICHPGQNKNYRSNGAHVFDISDGLGLAIEGLGVGQLGPRIMHAGNNKFVRIRKNYATANQFWATAAVKKLSINGAADDFSSGNLNSAAIAIEISDMWGAELEDLFIQGYLQNTSGAAISLYNDTAWTEGTRFKNVVVRGTSVGIWMHRNGATGSTATDSFFDTSGDISINAGVNTPVTYLKVGDGTQAGKCFLYGHRIKMTGWMSRSSWHTGIEVTDWSTCVNGKFILTWDGYGINKDSTVEVLHMIRCTGANARFDCDVENYSGQSLAASLNIVQLIWNSCVYTLEPTALAASYAAGYPVIRARGLKINFRGTFSADQCVSGLSYSLSGLLPGQRIRVRLNTWAGNNQYQTTLQEWEVIVRGADYPCVLVPIYLVPLSTTTGTAVTSTTGPTTDTFVKTVTLGLNQSGINTTGLTITNGQVNNAIGYAVNSGRKINFVLPANSAATQEMPYNVEIEIL